MQSGEPSLRRLRRPLRRAHPGRSGESTHPCEDSPLPSPASDVARLRRSCRRSGLGPRAPSRGRALHVRGGHLVGDPRFAPNPPPALAPACVPRRVSQSSVVALRTTHVDDGGGGDHHQCAGIARACGDDVLSWARGRATTSSLAAVTPMSIGPSPSHPS
eukprot:scaffold1588_cov408-Prasinococcus_capsulatus_cf.AAC.7